MSEEQVEAIFQHACEGAAESIGSTRTDWQRVVDAIRFLRRSRDDARKEAVACAAAHINAVAQLSEARRLLDDARAQHAEELSRRIAMHDAQMVAALAMPEGNYPAWKELVIAELQGSYDTDGITHEDSGDALIYLQSAIGIIEEIAVPDCLAAPVPAQPSHFRARLIELCQPWTPANLDRIESCEEIVRAVAEGPHSQPAAVPEAVAKDAAAILVQALEEIAWQRPLGVRPSKSGEAMERAAIIALHKYNALLSAADTEVKNG